VCRRSPRARSEVFSDSDKVSKMPEPMNLSHPRTVSTRALFRICLETVNSQFVSSRPSQARIETSLSTGIGNRRRKGKKLSQGHRARRATRACANLPCHQEDTGEACLAMALPPVQAAGGRMTDRRSPIPRGD
jgi:hypothetical protein